MANIIVLALALVSIALIGTSFAARQESPECHQECDVVLDVGASALNGFRLLPDTMMMQSSWLNTSDYVIGNVLSRLPGWNVKIAIDNASVTWSGPNELRSNEETYKLAPEAINAGGTYGFCVRARTSDRSKYVIKVSKAKLAQMNPRRRRAWQREYAFQSSIKDEHVVKAYDFFEGVDGDGGIRYFVVLEAATDTLRKHMLTRNLWDNQVLLTNLFTQLIDGLMAIHLQSIAHLDIKEENVLVQEEMGVKRVFHENKFWNKALLKYTEPTSLRNALVLICGREGLFDIRITSLQDNKGTRYVERTELDLYERLYTIYTTDRSLFPVQLIVEGTLITLKYTDFGLSHEFDYPMIGDDGTPGYIPPEFYRATPSSPTRVGPENDIFALASMFVKLATGTELFFRNNEPEEALKRRVLEGGYLMPNHFLKLHINTQETIMEMLQVNPEERVELPKVKKFFDGMLRHLLCKVLDVFC